MSGKNTKGSWLSANLVTSLLRKSHSEGLLFGAAPLWHETAIDVQAKAFDHGAAADEALSCNKKDEAKKGEHASCAPRGLDQVSAIAAVVSREHRQSSPTRSWVVADHRHQPPMRIAPKGSRKW